MPNKLYIPIQRKEDFFIINNIQYKPIAPNIEPTVIFIIEELIILLKSEVVKNNINEIRLVKKAL
jgi:hypothetical protein